MSFSQDVRSSGNFQEQFGKQRRRQNKSEVSKDDLQSLQAHVNNSRTQIDFAYVYFSPDNLNGNALGPHSFIFEPDKTEVMIFNTFNTVYGNGIKLDKTLNSISYDVIDTLDSTNILSTITFDAGSYHYEPYQTFNGVDYYVEQADSAPLDLTQFSIACWFRTTHDYSITDAMLVDKGGIGTDTAGSNMNYGIWFDSGDDNKVTAGFEEGAGTDHFTVSSSTLNDGNWHHGCVTYDQVNVKLYIDGSATGTPHATGTSPENNAQPLRVGANSRNLSRFFDGDIDEVYVWNNDLTAGEVSALWSAGTVPQTGNIVYSNTFGGSSSATIVTKNAYYAVPDGAFNWDWTVGFHPVQLRNVSSIPLNVGTATKQFLYYDNFGTDLDFSAQNFSDGLWIYPTDVSNSGSPRVVEFRYVDANNQHSIEIGTDAILYTIVKNGGVQTKREYTTTLNNNNWYYISRTWNTTPTLSLKVNDNADAVSTRSTGTAATSTKLFYGSYPGASTAQDYKGYICYPHYYKHGTVLTGTERTSLYNYGTRTNIINPGWWGFFRFG